MVDAQLTLVTQAEAARRMGVSRQAINKAVVAGRLTAHGPRKMIDLGTAATELADAISRVDPYEPDERPIRVGSENSLTAAKLETERQRGRLLQLQREEKEGRLIDRDQVELEQEVAARLVRQALDQLPSRAEDLYAEAQKNGVRGLKAALKKLVRAAEESLSRSLSEAADRIEAERIEAEPDYAG